MVGEAVRRRPDRHRHRAGALGREVLPGGRRLVSPYGHLGLVPGSYRFHHLRGTRSLVSAEALDGAAEGLEGYREIVDAAAQADLRDLPSRQIAPLVGASGTRLWKRIGGATLVAALLLGVWAVFIFDLLPGIREQLGDGPGPALVLTAAVGGFFAWQLWRIHNLWGDLRTGQVVVSGVGTTSADLSDPEAPRYSLHIAGITLKVRAQVYRALIEGRDYRVTYAPRSKTLLTIEPLQ